MKLPITLLVIATIGQAADSKVPPASKSTDVNKSNKRELYEGNYGLRNGLSFETKFGPTPRIEYVDDSKVDLSDKSIFGARVPQISKISDVLTGHGPPFEVALANHLYSPVSVYQARLSSPTTFDVPSDTSHLGYPKHNPYKQSQQYSEQYEQNARNPHNNVPKPGYQPEYSREESKLLHLETAFPRLEPSYSTPASISQDIYIQNLPNIDSQLYPLSQFSYQHVEQIPLRYPDGTIQPMQYVQQSLGKLVPVQSDSGYVKGRRDQDNQPTERPEPVQISTEAPNQDYSTLPQVVPNYASFYQSQPYAPSQQYLPGPQLRHLQPQGEYQLGLKQSTTQPEEQLVQVQQGNQYQQYQQYLQTQEPRTELPQQEVQIGETTPQPDGQYQSTQEIQDPSPTQPEPVQPENIPTFESFSEYSTTPTLLETEDPTTTVAPYTTHKPLPRIPLAPLRPLPGSRRLPQPRPFSNTQPTTVTPTPFSPLPAFRRFPHLNTRRPTLPTFSTTFSSTPTVTTTPHPDPTEVVSTQALPSITTVSRTPIIRIRHKPSYNQFQSTTPQPTRPVLTTLEPLSQPTTTFQPSTTLEQDTQLGIQTVQTQQPDPHAKRLQYLPPPELPPRPQSEVIYHLQSQPLAPSSPQPELLYPKTFQIQASSQPQLRFYPQSPPPPQSYPQPLLIQPSLRSHLQSVLPPRHIQLYQPPVFNLRPQFEPLSTPLPPLQLTEELQPKSQPRLHPRPDVQEPKKLKPLTETTKDLKEGDTYLPPRTIVSSIQPILHPQVYSQSHELFIQPDFHHLAAPTFPSVQYFGKYAQSIFGHYH